MSDESENKQRLLIVDDSKVIRVTARKILQDHFKTVEALDGENAWEILGSEEPFSLIVSDLTMPKLDGFDVLELLGDESPVVIFVTAYDEFALRAFDTYAVDYLLKPVKVERLATALERAEDKFRLSQLERYMQMTQNHQTANQPIQRICVREQSAVHIIPATEIMFIEAQEDYININSVKGEFLKNDQLSRITALLDETAFCRIHRFYLININFLDRIESLTKDRRIAVLKNKKKLPVSRSGYDRLTALIKS